ncbi:TrfA [Alcaligenaceae bacterium]|nr:TrfA [Alcaligenaceae bacterium]
MISQAQTPRIALINTLARLSESAQQRAAQNDDTLDLARPKFKRVFLPGIAEDMRAMPNYIARSSIFAPVRRGHRVTHDDAVFLRSDRVLIKGSGKQLAEDHADIWMQAMYLQMTCASGEQPVINRADFLRSLGRNTSGASYQWLHDGMKDLARFTLSIEATRANGTLKYSYGHHPASRVLPMLGGFDYDDENQSYRLYVDPRWAQIFSNREFTLIDWSKRLSMRYELSKSLQRLIGTSKDPEQRYSLQILKERAHYAGRLRDFRPALERALDELAELGLIGSPRVETSTRGVQQAVWFRVNEPQ